MAAEATARTPAVRGRPLAPVLGATVLQFDLGNRAAIEDQIETLIALLDALDGDCDAEDDREDDPLDHGEADETANLFAPAYGIDQTLGPINGHQIISDHYRRLRGGL
jgi:hypothetical protein